MYTLGWAWLHLRGGQADDQRGGAEALFRRMLEISRRTRGEEDEWTLHAMNGRSVGSSRRLNKLDEAANLEQRMLDIRRRTKGPEDRKTRNRCTPMPSGW